MASRSTKSTADRARARASWPVRVFKSGTEPSDDLSNITTAEERLAMMWPLAVEAWTLSGKTLPSYSRSEIPIRHLPPPHKQTDAE
ncbi:MAG: hypothetical protein JSV66_01515 [Trueperaceae bacterium]|nr:MAG: hypothetical protein JSV66_01515 [Trueperaceae bacterium]